MTKKKRDKLIDILVQRSPGAQEKNHDKCNDGREGRKSQVERDSVRPFVCHTQEREKEPPYYNCAHSKPCSEADRCRGNYCDILDSRLTFYNLTSNWKLLVGHSRNPHLLLSLWWAFEPKLGFLGGKLSGHSRLQSQILQFNIQLTTNSSLLG